MSDQIECRKEYQIGQHRVQMTARQAEIWNRGLPLHHAELRGAKIRLGRYWIPLAAAFESIELAADMEDEKAIPAVPLTSAPPAL
jgi:hypothetical protein